MFIAAKLLALEEALDGVRPKDPATVSLELSAESPAAEAGLVSTLERHA